MLECPTVSERGIVRTIVLFGLLLKLENKISHSTSSEVIEIYIYFRLWFKLLFTSGQYKKLEFHIPILNCSWQFNLLEFERSFVELFHKDFDFISQVSLDLDSSRQWDNNSKKSREGNCCASYCCEKGRVRRVEKSIYMYHELNNKVSNMFPIHYNINIQSVMIIGKLKSNLKRSRSRIIVLHIKTLEEIYRIYRLRNKYNFTQLHNLETKKEM